MAFWRRALARAFTVAACAVGIPAVAGGGYLRFSGRPLAPGEASAAHEVFGDEIDTGQVRLHYLPFLLPALFSPTKALISGFTLPGHVFLLGQADGGDFTQGPAPGLAMHELTHVWQYQTGQLLKNFCTNYDYALTVDSRFGAFCIEQQAAMIEDYDVQNLHPDVDPPGPPDGLLVETVEARFPAAARARARVLEKAVTGGVAPKPGR